jgi:hypothetical protein
MFMITDILFLQGSVIPFPASFTGSNTNTNTRHRHPYFTTLSPEHLPQPTQNIPGCQMVYFHTKTPNLSTTLRALK